jgi:DNA-binding PadR family transcriptional regulator
MATRRKVNNLLALAVLALATERPMHPYEMAALLRQRGKDQSIKINWGSLYTVVANLEKHGLIEATETVREGRRPERTVYTATESGREELRDWMRELLGTPEKEFPRFTAALSLVAILPPDEVAELLSRRVGALVSRVDEIETALEAHAHMVPRLFLVEAEYELAMLRAEADWTRSFRQEITDGTLPGVAAWRKFHETGELPAEVLALMEQERGQEPD